MRVLVMSSDCRVGLVLNTSLTASTLLPPRNIISVSTIPGLMLCTVMRIVRYGVSQRTVPLLTFRLACLLCPSCYRSSVIRTIYTFYLCRRFLAPLSRHVSYSLRCGLENCILARFPSGLFCFPLPAIEI